MLTHAKLHSQRELQRDSHQVYQQVNHQVNHRASHQWCLLQYHHGFLLVYPQVRQHRFHLQYLQIRRVVSLRFNHQENQQGNHQDNQQGNHQDNQQQSQADNQLYSHPESHRRYLHMSPLMFRRVYLLLYHLRYHLWFLPGNRQYVLVANLLVNLPKYRVENHLPCHQVRLVANPVVNHQVSRHRNRRHDLPVSQRMYRRVNQRRLHQ